MKQETLYITQNSPFSKDVKVFTSSGEVADLTGFSASMFISKYFGSETKYSVSSTINNPTSGIVRISISANSTKLLPYGAMQYTIYLTPSAGDGSIILQGQAIIIPSVY